MVYAEFGGQTECIMGNWKIENTWNGYTAENQEAILFFNETAFLFWCPAL